MPRQPSETYLHCTVCGKSRRVPPSKAERKYCSKACFQELRKRVKCVCASCGNEFLAKPHRVKLGWAKYCNFSCYRRKLTRVCLSCGKTFAAQPGLVAKGRAKYCSRECYRALPGKSPVICAGCGITVWFFKSKVKSGAKYCSDSCCRSHRASIKRTCPVCGRDFFVTQSLARKGHGRFCSKPCKGIALSKPIEERFWALVNKTDGCWLWTGAQTSTGYGFFERTKAHRMAWMLANGDIPDGLFVCHRCDVPLCVNVAHMFLGTHADNMADAAAKGRTRKGERHQYAKLTDAIVLEARHRHASEKISVPKLAAEYAMPLPALRNALAGKTWKHIP